MRNSRRLFAGLLVAVAAMVVAPTAASASPSVTVHNGQSIQAAINAAAPGTTINVDPGTYAENLFIQKTLTLQGSSVVLVQPGSPNDSLCDDGGTVTGICVIGQLDNSFNLVSRVANVTISGFTVRDFTGDGIFSFGAKNFKVTDSTTQHNGGYGIVSFNVAGVTYKRNISLTNRDAGFYIGDSANAGAVVENNNSHDNSGEGLLFRDSRHGSIQNNNFHDNCVGLLMLDTGAPTPGGDVIVRSNTVNHNNKLCSGNPEEGEPATGGVGIGIAGVDNAVVQANDARNNKEHAGTQIPGGGIVLISTACFGGRTPNNNQVDHNNLSNNLPVDLSNDGTGSGNSISNNGGGTTGSAPGPCGGP